MAACIALHCHDLRKLRESSEDGFAAVGGHEGEEFVASGVGGPEGGEEVGGAVLEEVKEFHFAALGHLAFAEIVDEEEIDLAKTREGDAGALSGLAVVAELLEAQAGERGGADCLTTAALLVVAAEQGIGRAGFALPGGSDEIQPSR